jgi:predicted Rossmann-fold nucleotide-binding protein
MAELSDAFIALPGGYGTTEELAQNGARREAVPNTYGGARRALCAFEEFCEMLTWTQLGLHRKPCGILNVEGYYDPLLELFDRAVAEQFVKPVHRRMVIAHRCPESLVARLPEYEPPAVDKWIDLKEA